MVSFQSNRIITRLVLLSFKGLFFFTAIRILFSVLYALTIYDAHWSPKLEELNDIALSVLFVITGLLYMSWYYIINVNYLQTVKAEKNLNAYWSVGVWLLPIANSIAPYMRLKNIAHDYGVENNSLVHSTKKYLMVWTASFVVWYGLILFFFNTTPLFSEDLEIYYSLHPMLKYMHDNLISIVELVGMAAMMIIVKNISILENLFHTGKKEIDLTDHMIERPN